jgi:hypothetical protein
MAIRWGQELLPGWRCGKKSMYVPETTRRVLHYCVRVVYSGAVVRRVVANREFISGAREIGKSVYYLRHVCPSARPPARMELARIRQIFMKCDI